MSTIKVTNINPPTAGEAVNLNGLAYPTAGPLSNRNLIINGAMQVAQRGTQVTGVTSSGYRAVDRFRPSMGSLGTWTIEQSTDAPDGFAYSHKFTCTTADASPAAGDDIEMEYKVEAQDLQHLNYGSASAQAMTLSFWVKSNKTGTATVNILQPDNSNKSLSPTYTISSADTWEHKTISIPGDTAGAISNDNGIGLLFAWWLNSGSNFNSGTNRTTWTALDSADRNASNLGVGGAVNDYWQITGVQLEVGSVATPFEHRSYGDELRRCQRYYVDVLAGKSSSNTAICIGAQYNSSAAFGTIHLPVQMRTGPAIEVSNSSAYYRLYANGSDISVSTFLLDAASNARAVDIEASASGTGGHAVMFRTKNSAAIFRLTAEL